MQRDGPQLRLRLKADGRIVEILDDGTERLVGERRKLLPETGSDAAYARQIRARTQLTQVQFAERIGVPIETVRNWEQGKRSPRGPARALLKLIEAAPDLAFAALAKTPSR